MSDPCRPRCRLISCTSRHIAPTSCRPMAGLPSALVRRGDVVHREVTVVACQFWNPLSKGAAFPRSPEAVGPTFPWSQLGRFQHNNIVCTAQHELSV